MNAVDALALHVLRSPKGCGSFWSVWSWHAPTAFPAARDEYGFGAGPARPFKATGVPKSDGATAAPVSESRRRGGGRHVFLRASRQFSRENLKRPPRVPFRT